MMWVVKRREERKMEESDKDLWKGEWGKATERDIGHMAQITDAKEHGGKTNVPYKYITLSEKLCRHNGAFLHLKYDLTA
jgi:hypothetical protein